MCGIQAKVSQPNGTLPGYCCVDAPWQLNDLDWGHAFQCPEDSKDAQCTNYGPYFSGLSTEACDSYGGTWCPNPQNCTRLKACIEDYIERAETTQHKNAAFAAYLESAPTIDDVTNAEQCGRTREYFGYSALYVNDEDICGNIEQFSYSRDLKFIEEFFSGTSAGNGPDDDLSGPPDLEVPALKVQIEEGEDMIEALLEPLAVLPFVTLKAEPRGTTIICLVFLVVKSITAHGDFLLLLQMVLGLKKCKGGKLGLMQIML